MTRWAGTGAVRYGWWAGPGCPWREAWGWAADPGFARRRGTAAWRTGAGTNLPTPIDFEGEQPPVGATWPVSGSGLRASDADREQAARVLWVAAGEGFLTPDEAEDRVTAAYAARFRDELASLTADLPDGGRWLAREASEDAPPAWRALAVHATVAAVVATALVGAWAVLHSHTWFFWPAWPLAFLTLGLVGHARRVSQAPRRPYRAR